MYVGDYGIYNESANCWKTLIIGENVVKVTCILCNAYFEGGHVNEVTVLEIRHHCVRKWHAKRTIFMLVNNG